MRTYNEEVELEGRDPERDYVLYKNTCEALATLMSEIQELKASGAKEGVSTFFKKKKNHELPWVKAECNLGKPTTICVFVYPECRGWSKTQARMCSLHHSEEAESSVTHEAEESTGSDTWGTHNAHFVFLFNFRHISSALIWSSDVLQAKQKVDVLHLQLQNLLYEVMHLQKEIGKCLEFK